MNNNQIDNDDMKKQKQTNIKTKIKKHNDDDSIDQVVSSEPCCRSK